MLFRHDVTGWGHICYADFQDFISNKNCIYVALLNLQVIFTNNLLNLYFEQISLQTLNKKKTVCFGFQKALPCLCRDGHVENAQEKYKLKEFYSSFKSQWHII